MAEGLARRLLPSSVQVFSAGVQADGQNRFAVAVMKEIGIDISEQYSKTLDSIPLGQADLVITFSDRARIECEKRVRSNRLQHWPVPDPYEASGNENEVMDVYRAVRNIIERKLTDFFISEGEIK
jgi:arsenate reductase